MAARGSESRTQITRFSYAAKMFFFNSGKLTAYLSLKPVLLFIKYLSGLHFILKYRDVELFAMLGAFKGKL